VPWLNLYCFWPTFRYIDQLSHPLTVSVLREAKTSLEHECNQLRIRNDTLIQQASQLQNEKVNMQQEKNNVISELKGELKMKCFEYTTLGVTFEVLYRLLVSYGVHYRI
jgi:FtsZ-binding cell division protein ZapB